MRQLHILNTSMMNLFKSTKYILTFTLLFFCSIIFSQKISILFIGNSLTQIGDTPKYLSSILADNQKDNLIEDISKPGYTLNDHLKDKETLEKINEKNWNYIILQGASPSYLKPIARKNFIREVFFFDSLAKKMNTKVILYSPYSNDGYPKQFCDFEKNNYECSNTFFTTKQVLQYIDSINIYMVKKFSNITIAPIGNLIFKLYPYPKCKKLWIDEMMHPSEKGAKINALVYFYIITEKKKKLKKTIINNKENKKIFNTLCKGELFFY